MASDSAAGCSIPTLPPAIPNGMEAALGVPLPLAHAVADEPAASDTLAVTVSDFELENNVALQSTEDAGLIAGVEADDHRTMKMPDFWQAVATENNLASLAQARAVVGTALRLATTQARDHGSFRMGSYVKFTRVKRGTELISSTVDMTPLAKVQKDVQ